MWVCEANQTGADGSSVSFDSYINNLHPQQHKPLYGTLAACFQRMLLLFESVLTVRTVACACEFGHV